MVLGCKKSPAPALVMRKGLGWMSLLGGDLTSAVLYSAEVWKGMACTSVVMPLS